MEEPEETCKSLSVSASSISSAPIGRGRNFSADASDMELECLERGT